MIIRIAGLPGSGKTTLGEALSKHLEYKLFRIDQNRDHYKDEFYALNQLFRDMYEEEDDFILDSTGFNPRIHWIFQFLKSRVIDIKLICEKDVLKTRIESKNSGGYFPYPTTRMQYMDDYFADMEHKHADITINTSHLTKESMVRCALENLSFYGVEPPEKEITTLIIKTMAEEEKHAELLKDLEKSFPKKKRARILMDARFAPSYPNYPLKKKPWFIRWMDGDV